MKKNNISTELEDSLVDFGLTPKQVRVYLAALQLGTASVQQIADQATVERTNAYDAIKSLIDKRLMSITSHGKKNLFSAEPPEVLKRIIREKEEKLTQLLPELRSLHNSSSAKPRIQFYPGIEGYKTVYENIFTAKEKQLVGIYSTEDINEILGESFARTMVERRVRAGIHLRVIRSKEKEKSVPGIFPPSKEELREVRFSPPGMVFPITTYVYDNKVIILSSKKETFGLIMESADVAQAHRYYFEALWQIAKP